jgi:hypothetical protein
MTKAYPSFEDFLAMTWPTNAWIREPGLNIYVRKTFRLRDSVTHTVDLANVTADVPGSGSLTKFLDRYEPGHIFYLENVFETRLREYYERRGYVIVNNYFP